MRRKEINLSGGTFERENAIVVDNILFDIGAPVIKWWEKEGFNGYTEKRIVIPKQNRATGREWNKVIKGPRYAKRKKGLKGITQAFIHHSGGDGRNPRNMFETLYNQRDLSVNFANEDNGTIYQYNDTNVATRHGGKHNQISLGIENCLYPLVKSSPNYYSPARNKRTGNLPHKKGFDTVHGVKMQVFKFPQVQIDSLARLIAGNWVALYHLTGESRFLYSPELPRSNKGNVIKTVIKNPKEHVGMIAHFHATRKKIDPLGMDWEKLDELTQRYFWIFVGNLPNATEFVFD